MAILNTHPQVIDIEHYGGDTLTLHLTVPTEVIAGRVFSAQVRSKQGSPRLDATFQVILTPTGADIVLLADDCRRLANRGEYSGRWDVQLTEADGTDPITTIAFGSLVIIPDVTRIPVTA